MTQPINLTDEQHSVRASVSQFSADKIAPLAADADLSQEFSSAAFDALKGMEKTAL